MRVVRRDESRVIDSVKEISVDREPPRVTLLSATPSVIATGRRARRRRCGCATAARRTGRRCSASSAPTTGEPRIVRRFRGGPNRAARLGRPGERRPAADRAGAGGRLRVHGRRARPRGQPDRGAAAGAAGRGGAAGHRRLGAQVHAARPAVGGHGGRVRAPRGRAGRPQLRLGRVAPRRPQGGAARRPRGRALPDPDPEQDQDRRLPRPRAGGRAARGLAARGGRAAAQQRSRRRRARWSCCPRSPGRD